MLKEFDVVITYIEYSDGPGGKRRPAVVTKVNGDQVILRRITSKFHNKSDYIKQKYYEIKDWSEAKLDKPSWVDIKPPIRVNVNEFQIRAVGEFSPRDIIGLQQFLSERGE